jgi:TRAP-type C4-dicarboxylate transport system permease small subunit
MSSLSGDARAGLMRLFRLMERLSIGMAVIGGALLTALAFFITADVLGRGYGGFYSGATDEIAGFTMTLAVTWALAYTLTIDKHVRVDLLLGVVSAGVRRVLDWIALVLLTAFATMLAVKCWDLALDSLAIGSLSPSVLQVPIGIPQSTMALGFTILSLQAFITLLVATLDPSGFDRERNAERAAAPTQFDV